VHQYLKGGCREDGDRFLPVVLSDRARGSEHKLEQRRFPLYTRHHFCAGQVMEHLHRLPRGYGISSLELPSWAPCSGYLYWSRG